MSYLLLLEMAEDLRRVHREVLGHWKRDMGGLLRLILPFFFDSQKWGNLMSSNVTFSQRCIMPKYWKQARMNWYVSNWAVIIPSFSVCESLMHVWEVFFLCAKLPPHFLAWDSILLSWPSWPLIHSSRNTAWTFVSLDLAFK